MIALVSDMSPTLRKKYLDFSYEMILASLPFDLTRVASSYQEQVALYAQGREPLSIVNKYRAMAGLYLLKTEKENIIVTWTLNSKHIVNRENKSVFDDYSHAFDIILIKTITPLKPQRHYDLKISANKNNIPDYLEASTLGEKVGLIVGAKFKNKLGKPRPDFPHYEE